MRRMKEGSTKQPTFAATSEEGAATPWGGSSFKHRRSCTACRTVWLTSSARTSGRRVGGDLQPVSVGKNRHDGAPHCNTSWFPWCSCMATHTEAGNPRYVPCSVLKAANIDGSPFVRRSAAKKRPKPAFLSRNVLTRQLAIILRRVRTC